MQALMAEIDRKLKLEGAGDAASGDVEIAGI